MEGIEAFVPVPDTVVPLLAPEVVSSRLLRKSLPDDVRAALADKVKQTWFYQEGWPRRLSESLDWVFDFDALTVSFAQPQVAATLATRIRRSDFRFRLLYPLLHDAQAMLFKVVLPDQLIGTLVDNWQRESTASTWLELLWSDQTPLAIRQEIAEKLLVKKPKPVAAVVAALAFSELPDEEILRLLLTPATVSQLDRKKLETFMAVLFAARPSMFTLDAINALPPPLRLASLAAAAGNPLAPEDVVLTAVTEALADPASLPYTATNALYAPTTSVSVAELLWQGSNSQAKGAITARLEKNWYGQTVETMTVERLLVEMKSCTRRYESRSQFDPGRLQRTTVAAVFANELTRRLPALDKAEADTVIDAVYDTAAEAAVVGLSFPGCPRHQLSKLFASTRENLLSATVPETRTAIFGPSSRNALYHRYSTSAANTRVKWRTLTERDFVFDNWDQATERYLANEIASELGTAPSAWSFLFSLIKQNPTAKLGDLVQLAAAT